MGTLPVCIYVPHTHAMLMRPDEGVRATGAGVTDACELRYRESSRVVGHCVSLSSLGLVGWFFVRQGPQVSHAVRGFIMYCS